MDSKENKEKRKFKTGEEKEVTIVRKVQERGDQSKLENLMDRQMRNICLISKISTLKQLTNHYQKMNACFTLTFLKILLAKPVQKFSRCILELLSRG